MGFGFWVLIEGWVWISRLCLVRESESDSDSERE